MKREIILTADGSNSIAIPEMHVTYHSTHGAIEESIHIFIKAGLDYSNKILNQPASLTIFEMGFGTGLNALLTLAHAEKMQQKIYYETIELYPLEEIIYTALNYCEQLQRPDLEPLFKLLHQCTWNSTIEITSYFSFKKKQISLTDFTSDQPFNIIYFDAFAPADQPHLWTASIFKKLFAIMNVSAVLTTYCSKSVVRKAMTEAGLKVEKIAGPPHKREMVRAMRIS